MSNAVQDPDVVRGPTRALCRFWKDGADKDAEEVWKTCHKFIEADKKKKAGCELNEVEAHHYLQSSGKTMTALELRNELRKIDVDANGMMALLEYLLFAFKRSVSACLNNPQGTRPRARRAELVCCYRVLSHTAGFSHRSPVIGACLLIHTCLRAGVLHAGGGAEEAKAVEAAQAQVEALQKALADLQVQLAQQKEQEAAAKKAEAEAKASEAAALRENALRCCTCFGTHERFVRGRG